MGSLGHGAYSQDVPDGIYQHKYAAGGHPGFGGYLEALELDAVSGPVFLIQEYISDRAPGLPPSRYRWCQFDGMEQMEEAWKRALSFFNPDRSGFSEWSEKPFWEVVNYNDWPDEYFTSTGRRD